LSTRREARRLALDVLFQADVTEAPAPDVLRDWEGAGRAIPPFTQQIVDRVVEDGPAIDLQLEEHAEGWTVARMAPLDRTILRVAVAELLWGEVPASVAISEAVEAASELSSEGSLRFVNGILGRIARDLDAEAGP
jgi:transcription antitermination protein NusB